MRVLTLMGKVLLVVVVFMLVRWSWPRFRYDQLMALAWKVMLPLGLVNFVIVAVLDQLRVVWGWEGTWGTVLVGVMSWTSCVIVLVMLAMMSPAMADNRVSRFVETEEDLL